MNIIIGIAIALGSLMVLGGIIYGLIVHFMFSKFKKVNHNLSKEFNKEFDDSFDKFLKN